MNLDDAELRELLAHGKYTHWAKDMTNDQLVAVLWLVGEFAVRYRSDLDSIIVAERDHHPGGLRRAWEALRWLGSITRTALSSDEVRQKMREVMAGPRPSGPSQPETVQVGGSGIIDNPYPPGSRLFVNGAIDAWMMAAEVAVGQWKRDVDARDRELDEGREKAEKNRRRAKEGRDE
jgi:hypothetical protein